jgi:DNA-binding MarR family transcriptional regulator
MSKKLASNNSLSGVGILLACAELRWQRAADEALQELDLSPTQFVLMAGLQLLDGGSEPITQAHLSRYVGTDVMLTSKHVRLLEERGFVSREVHPSDSRARSLTLTRNGVATLKQATKAISKVDKALFGKHSADKLRKQLSHVLGWSQ